MAGIASICIGKRKTGKTTFSQKLIQTKPSSMPCVIYDINQEYGKFYSEPFEDFDVFMQRIVDLRGHYILLEEATIFFRAQKHNEQMINLLVRARHTRNIIQLNFHSFKSVPKDIYNLLDYVTVFKTNDSLKDVKDKFDNPAIIQAYLDARNSTDPFFYRTVSIQ
jgi:hypothetical protein